MLTFLTLMERVLLLRRVPLLAGLAPSNIQPIAAVAHEYHFADGEIVFEKDEPGDELYTIVSGEVRVVSSRPGGRGYRPRPPGDGRGSCRNGND